MVNYSNLSQNIKYDITLITPSLNGKKYIKKLLQSIKRQTGGILIQHVVVDGGSTDGTIELLQEHGVEHYVFEGSSIYEAHNFGLTKIKSDAVAFINCDDYYSSDNVISLMLSELSDDSSIDIAYGTCNFVSEAGKLLYKMIPPRRIKYPLAKLRLFNISHPCWIARRSVFEKLGNYDTKWKFVSDMDFILKASRYDCCFKRVNITVADFLIHDSNASGTSAASNEGREFFKDVNGNSTFKRFLYMTLLGGMYLKDPRYVYFWMRRLFKRLLPKG
jgi:glycosyltransferase involved in cell wall biosynthesis